MDPMQIALIVLVVAGVWAVVEVALILRRTRETIASLDKTVEGINATIEDVRPVITRLDETIDSLQPALDQLEPLLHNSSIAVEALSADLLEVNAVLRDVSQISDNVSNASGAVSNIAGAATDKVSKLFNRKGGDTSDAASRVLTEAAGEDIWNCSGQDAPAESSDANSYYTYDPTSLEETSVQGEASDE